MRSLFFVLLVACVTAGVAVAQTTTDEPSSTTTVSTAPTTTIEPEDPPADMRFWPFCRERREARSDANRIRYHKGYRPTHRFYRTCREIPRWRRQENLSYWRTKRANARDAPRVGAFGRRWTWYEGHPESYSRGPRGFWRSTVLVRRTMGYNAMYWVRQCTRSEGSWRMVWNGGTFDPYLRYAPGPAPGGISSAYGPMQFMSGTLYGNVGGAFYFARTHGARGLPDRYKRWNSNLGQALAAGYMYLKGGTSAWTGSTC